MAPSMAANINPQGTAGLVGRATPLAFLLAAVAVLLIGCIKLLFVDRKMAVPMWQVVIPLAALAMLGYTIWRNVIPYPEDDPAQWSPVVAFGWVVLVAVAMALSPGLAQRLSVSLEKSDEAA